MEFWSSFVPGWPRLVLPAAFVSRAGLGNRFQTCPSAVGAAHLHLKLHQYSVETHFPYGPAELQIPFDFAQGRLSASLGGCDFLSFLVVCGRKAGKSLRKQASPGSFDSAP